MDEQGRSAEGHQDGDVVIEVRDLVAAYGAERILEGITFDVREREILVILGASGCGKTTLLKHLIGLLRPASGSVRLWGRDIARMEEDELDALRARFGVAFQSDALFNSITAAENVELPMREHGFDPELVPALAQMKLSVVGLGDAGPKMPSQLSGGMRKRVALARALALEPEIVFFDEPTAGLDPVTAAGIDQLILQLRELLGITVVVVTHELASIRTIADRALMLAEGRAIFLGPVADVERAPDRRVAQFFRRQPELAETPES
ncbi:MAG: ABC transporter ATP-binding protein [Candidatus Brocadiia bacterium]